MRNAVRSALLLLLLAVYSPSSIAAGWHTLVVGTPPGAASISLGGRPIDGELPSIMIDCTGYESHNIAPTISVLLPATGDFSIRAGDPAEITAVVGVTTMNWTGAVEANDSTGTAITVTPPEPFSLPQTLLESPGVSIFTASIIGNSVGLKITVPADGGADSARQFLDACGR